LNPKRIFRAFSMAVLVSINGSAIWNVCFI
jgi:hypothetical protein